MNEIRKDYILERYVLIAEKRDLRPNDFKSKEMLKPSATDYFAPGNENLTPEEIGRVGSKNAWSIRWFANKFAAMESEAFEKKTKTFLQSQPAFGYHEIIVETPHKTKQLWDLPQTSINTLLGVFQDRMSQLQKKKHIKYVQIFKNQGKDGGTSLIHAHTQVVALTEVPPSIKEKIQAIKKHRMPYQKILKKELQSERIAFQTRYFIAICPFASQFNFEIWLFPKKEYYSLLDMPDPIINDLAIAMKRILAKLRLLNCSYNFYLNYDPSKTMLFHLSFTPRIAHFAGFELGTGIIINSVSPEKAAAFYRK